MLRAFRYTLTAARQLLADATLERSKKLLRAAMSGRLRSAPGIPLFRPQVI
jgi:hypothetical protein